MNECTWGYRVGLPGRLRPVPDVFTPSIFSTASQFSSSPSQETTLPGLTLTGAHQLTWDTPGWGTRSLGSPPTSHFSRPDQHPLRRTVEKRLSHSGGTHGLGASLSLLLHTLSLEVLGSALCFSISVQHGITWSPSRASRKTCLLPPHLPGLVAPSSQASEAPQHSIPGPCEVSQVAF